MQKIVMVMTFLTASAFASTERAHHHLSPRATDEVVSCFECQFEAKGVGKEFDPAGMEKLALMTADLIGETRAQLLRGDFGIHGKKWYENKVKIYQYVLSSLRTAQEKNLSNQDLSLEFFKAKGIIYMVRAGEVEDEVDANATKITSLDPKQIIKTVRSYMEKNGMMKVRIPSEDLPIGKDGVALESAWLVSPLNPKHILTEEELALLTPTAIAELDVPDDHFIFNPQRFLDQHPAPWQDNEKWISAEIGKSLIKKFKLEESNPGFTYDLEAARKVVFFEDIKNTQSSAKINVRDVYNIRWKVKWSEEIQSAAIANRLFLAIGGRFTDFVYSIKKGREGTTMILQDPKAEPDKDALCRAVLPEDLVKCLKKSKYQFDISPFIDDQGLITQENLQEITGLLPKSALTVRDPQMLVGRYYMTFKEALFELRPQDQIIYGGPASFTRFGADRDRAVRGLLLFNSWINNNDTREPNNKGYLLPNFKGTDGKSSPLVYVGTQHDLGKSMASAISAANPNKFSTDAFIYRKDGFVRFDYLVLDLPGAWKKTSYADLYWMAKRIVKITRQQLEEIVASSGWPDFEQEAMVYKLLLRRNRIAKVFRLEHLLAENEREIVAPSRYVPLATVEERQRAASKYGVPFEKLEELFQSRKRPADFSDHVLRKGEVAECAETLLIRLMHWYSHPTGLDRRFSRYQFISIFSPHAKACGGLKKMEIL